MTSGNRFLGIAATSILLSATAAASDLSYTYLDFQAIDYSLGTSATQSPVPGQTVDIDAQSGDGIAVAGALALAGRFYAGGSFESSIIDVDAVIVNPLVPEGESASDQFDLIRSRIFLGYQREISANFDLIFEISSDSTEYDFGSFAGESFDTKDSGVGAAVGFRWNPTPPLEVFASGRYSSVGSTNLDDLTFDADEYFNAGVRWYFFEDTAISLTYESGAVDTVSFAMRFSFGNLPW